jgi:IclR family acetate operon transcriptional repressor
VVVPGLLVRELARIRRDGVAYDQEESGRGITCAASPVRGPAGEALAALSASGWGNRIPSTA